MGIFIQSAPDSAALESLEGSVPNDLLHKDEVATALAQRAQDSGEFQKAEEFIRAATSAKSRTFMPWLLLGQTIVQSEISQSYEKHGTEALFCDEDRLCEAEDALGQAFVLADEELYTSAMLDRLLHHGHILKCGPRSWRTKTGLPSPLQKG